MALNLHSVCDQMNKLGNLPDNLEFVVNLSEQSIYLRKKIVFPLKVASRTQMEDNIHMELASAAIDYVTGSSMVSPVEIVTSIRQQINHKRHNELQGVGGTSRGRFQE